MNDHTMDEDFLKEVQERVKMNDPFKGKYFIVRSESNPDQRYTIILRHIDSLGQHLPDNCSCPSYKYHNQPENMFPTCKHIIKLRNRLLAAVDMYIDDLESGAVKNEFEQFTDPHLIKYLIIQFYDGFSGSDIPSVLAFITYLDAIEV